MKIRLNVDDGIYDELVERLTHAGMEIDDDAEFVLTQIGKYSGHIGVTDEKGEKLHIKTLDIVFIESYGHTIEVHTDDGNYKTSVRLYQLASELDPSRFIRISNSVIVAKDKIKQIKPSFSMKFVLLMSNGMYADVTRGYYNIFKETMGI